MTSPNHLHPAPAPAPTSLKARVKSWVRRALRPALWPLHEELAALAGRVEDVARATNADDATMKLSMQNIAATRCWCGGAGSAGT